MSNMSKVLPFISDEWVDDIYNQCFYELKTTLLFLLPLEIRMKNLRVKTKVGIVNNMSNYNPRLQSSR